VGRGTGLDAVAPGVLDCGLRGGLVVEPRSDVGPGRGPRCSAGVFHVGFGGVTGIKRGI